jgi:hypothetical protein
VKSLEIKCQCCAKLETELKNIASELKTAIETIGILKEELGIDKV